MSITTPDLFKTSQASSSDVPPSIDPKDNFRDSMRRNGIDVCGVEHCAVMAMCISGEQSRARNVCPDSELNYGNLQKSALWLDAFNASTLDILSLS
jgi:hypothetical protein